MYAYDYHSRLDTPTGSFRRPWSPDPYDPLPSTGQLQHYEIEDGYRGRANVSGARRREANASDVSVEALDLADYTMSLRGQPPRQLYAYNPYDQYPPSPPPIRPLATGDTFASTPSLTTASTHTETSRRPVRRPFSLPPPSSYAHQRSYAPPFPPVNLEEPDIAYPDQVQDEVDIAQFPPWTKGWYNNGAKSPYPSANSRAHTSNVFDPAYSSSQGHGHDPYSPLSASHGYVPPTLNSHESSRNLLPWSNDRSESYGLPIDSEVKEERMKMLEREFGGKGYAQEEEVQNPVGSVDAKGDLITEGPKKRKAVRAAQVILSLGAAISGIYGALIIKPKSSPPPKGSIASYIMYILSVLTSLALLWLFALRPCCFRRSRRGPATSVQAPNGMMVLPVQQLPGGGKAKKKGGKKGKKGADGQGVQVNLIVDPGMFGRAEESSSGEDEGDGMPGGYDEFGSAHGSSTSYPGHKKRKRKRVRRRGVFAGLAMEEQWRVARKARKRMLCFDIAMGAVWACEFVYVLIGKRCPAGGYEGWCNAYNTATAASCLLAVAFGFSIFFEIKDLHASRASPRTRT
ncbi:hypothetical protein PUNSTDRAFT_104727 [Punctularia strigosozonata HHB-11173 SS5]|uniref:uncharacterized protein n=1 Tax=Punctularia strigosozonata (strain HHB-11173) TaxID=741275 RepID=UPI0004417D93|nr:uncharacterized protein PUNSTDRAFT_104727 [Punctularia strigosozonata HHB-11173 SS5]EIN07182.1 hypothetical protein PUNSTDRAFT_104727 [Punctularia strigosozonata HHB-11173 SS5]